MDARRALSAAFPELRLGTVEVIGRGWDSIAYLLDRKLVVRVPVAPGDDQAERTLREVRLLRELRGRLPVAIPEPVAVSVDEFCFAYLYLPGEPLERTIDVEFWCDVVEAVGAAALDLLPFDAVEYRLEAVERVSRSLPQDLRPIADRVLAEYGSRYEAAAPRALPMHGDLGLSHFLADEGGRPYAVIDWSDACLAPVEHELANLYWTDPRLVSRAAGRFDVDHELVALDHWANALADLGAGATGVAEHLRGLL